MDHETAHNIHNRRLTLQQLGQYSLIINKEDVDITGYARYSRDRVDDHYVNDIIHAREDFAESWKLFNSEPERLYTISPARFVFFLELYPELQQPAMELLTERMIGYLVINGKFTEEAVEGISDEEIVQLAEPFILSYHYLQVESEYDSLMEDRKQME